MLVVRLHWAFDASRSRNGSFEGIRPSLECIRPSLPQKEPEANLLQQPSKPLVVGVA